MSIECDIRIYKQLTCVREEATGTKNYSLPNNYG